MIKVSWSPQFCLLSRKTNINDMRSGRIPLEDRLMTFEGPEHLTQSDSISSPILSSDIEQICLNIVKHIQEVSGGNIQISRMILYFKIDEKNRLWLLFSSGIKVRQKFVNEEMVMEEEKSKGKQQKQDRIMSPILVLSSRKDVGVSQTKYENKVKNVQGVLSLAKQQEEKCYNCCAKGAEVYEISLGQVIQSYDAGILDEESKLIVQKLEQDAQNAKQKKEKRDEEIQAEENEDDYYIEESRHIPGIILKLWGKMDGEKYQKLKLNPSWLGFRIKVCMECYMLFSQTQVESQHERDMKQLSAAIKENTRKHQWQIVKTQPKQESKPNAKADPQLAQQQHPSRASKVPKIKNIHASSERLDDASTARQPHTLRTHDQFALGFLTERSPVFPTIEETHANSQRFPSQKVSQVYRHRQGLKQLPKTHSMLNLTQSTQSSLKHQARIDSIQELKQVLVHNQI